MTANPQWPLLYQNFWYLFQESGQSLFELDIPHPDSITLSKNLETQKLMLLVNIKEIMGYYIFISTLTLFILNTFKHLWAW